MTSNETSIVGMAGVSPGHESRVARLLTPEQIVKMSAIGVCFWFAAATGIRYGTSLGFFGGMTSIVLFALTVPMGWLTVIFVKRVAVLRSTQVVPGIAVGTVAATFCDGIALTWTPTLYRIGTADIVPGAAWLLWGVGCILAFGCLDAYRAAEE